MQQGFSLLYLTYYSSDISLINMSKSESRKLVQAFRRLGLSIKEIAAKCGVSASTVSLWCRDIILTEEQVRDLHGKMIDAGHRGRIIGAHMNRQKREESVVDCRKWAMNAINTVEKRDLFMIGIGIYWGEGSKSDRGNLSFVNSDPRMILLICRWLEIFFDVVRADLIPRISVNESHRNRHDQILNYWSNLLELPKSSFRRTIFIHSLQKKVYENRDEYYGLLILRVRKSTIIKRKILALLENIKNADVAQVARASHS